MRKLFDRYIFAGALIALIAWIAVNPRVTIAGIIQAIIPAAVPTANKQGNSSVFQLGNTAGATSGHCLQFDANLNVVDSGVVGCTGSGGAGTNFANLTTGVNTSGSSLTVGNTTTLTFSGSGVNNANQVNATTVPVNSAANQALITTASATGAWATLPNAPNGLTYNTSTHAFGAGSAGALVLIEQHTASSSAELDFTTCITATYDEYQVEINNLLVATSAAQIELQMSTDGGSTYDTGNNYEWAVGFTLSSAAGGNEGGTSVAFIQVGPGQMDNSLTWGGASGWFKLHNPANASSYKFVEGQTASKDNRDTVMNRRTLGGVYRSTTAVNAFRFIPSSGNIASGTARCYGLAK